MGAKVLVSSEKQINESYMRYYMLRINKGMSDKEVADAAGVALSALANWRTGKAMPSVKTLFKLAQYLDTQVSYLVEGRYIDPAGIAT